MMAGGSVIVASVICIAVGRYLGIVCTTTVLWDILVGLAVGESVEMISSNIGGQIIGPVKRCCCFPCLRCGNVHHLGVISGRESGSVAHARGILCIGSV